MGMTNEEREKYIRVANVLIGAINDSIRPILMYQIEKDVTREALENYIKMLEQQPCEDCISREEVNQEISYISYEFGTRANDIVDRMRERCKNLPSVTPSRPTEQQPRQGHWIKVTNGRGGHECDVCHDYAPSFQSGNEYLSAFCPNCGAKMAEREVNADG